MGYALLCSLSFFLQLVAGLCDATEYSILGFAMARRHELWAAKHGRVYGDEAEKAMRFEVFKRNVEYIEAYNAGNHSNTLGVNEFADLTAGEVVARYTGAKVPDVMESDRQYDDVGPEPADVSVLLPSSVDWRDHNAVSSVKHQGGCQCCWAFTAAATVEGLVAIKTDVLHDLSVQQLVDCDTRNTQCNPGYVYKAYEYIVRNGGITTGANYPYTAVEGVCDAEKAAATIANITGDKHPVRNSEWALKIAVARQPIGVAIDASSPEFQAHSAGIFSGPCNDTVNHAVTIVGYGEEGKKKYWIVKNSWGADWGEDGYVKMEREAGARKGLCAIAAWPVYPIM